MIITPNGYEVDRPSKRTYEGTAEKAISNGFEDAMRDKGRECGYEFTIETKSGVKYIHCEVKLENGYEVQFKHKANAEPDLTSIERQSYQFLLERL